MTPNNPSDRADPETPKYTTIPGFDDPAASGIVHGILSELETQRKRLNALEAASTGTADMRERLDQVEEIARLKFELLKRDVYIELDKISDLLDKWPNMQAPAGKTFSTSTTLGELAGFSIPPIRYRAVLTPERAAQLERVLATRMVRKGDNYVPAKK